ncbi:MAG: TraR/DksA C4-type zinc finger protein [Acidimicrobiales bacterium]|nr:TraR/DksA C4-type zinc finger protein [Acidimicrobiales bacterium]
MATADETTIRADLETEREELTHRLGELSVGGVDAPDFDENFADSAQVTAEQVENATLAANLRDQLDDVESALQRLDEGTYGTCEVCGATIAPARLEAMPSTRFCIDHA